MDDLNLQLFAEGAAEGAGKAAEGAGKAAAPAKSERVVYGKQEVEKAPEAEMEDPADAPIQKVATPAERKAAFESLIGGTYKAEFSEQVERLTSERLQKSKVAEEQSVKVQPLLDLLSKKYGLHEDDPTAILDALAADDTFFTDAAEKLGMNVKQYRALREVQMENDALRAVQQESEQERQSKERFAAVLREGEAVKAQFPQFDLRAEMGNPQFMSMLATGIPVEHAYKVLHMDELMTGAMQATANAVSEQVTQNIRARQARPSETGLSGQSGVIVKNDVSKLTAKDRQEIAKRAAMGEEIRF